MTAPLEPLIPHRHKWSGICCLPKGHLGPCVYWPTVEQTRKALAKIEIPWDLLTEDDQ